MVRVPSSDVEFPKVYIAPPDADELEDRVLAVIDNASPEEYIPPPSPLLAELDEIVVVALLEVIVTPELLFSRSRAPPFPPAVLEEKVLESMVTTPLPVIDAAPPLAPEVLPFPDPPNVSVCSRNSTTFIYSIDSTSIACS